MEGLTAQPQGISHTCYGSHVVKYHEPIPAWMVRTREELSVEFDQKPEKQQPTQENTLKT